MQQKKGKLSVAYALLRKPFTDELLLLEQLLADKEEFIDRFYIQGDPDLYDPQPRKYKINNESTIKRAIDKLTSTTAIDAEFIFNVRYDKACEYGINGISNKALHIVTSDYNYKTQNQNLNFIFATQESRESMWQHFYYSVPYLLIYTASVVDEIIFSYLPDEIITKFCKIIKRQMIFLIWSFDVGNVDEI